MFFRFVSFVFVSGICLLGMGLLNGAACAQEPAETAAAVAVEQTADGGGILDDASLMQKSSYIIGYNTTRQLLTDMKGQGVELDLDKLKSGVQAAIDGKEIGMTEEEVRSVAMAFQSSLEKKMVERMTVVAKKNEVEGAEFQAKFAAGENAKKLDSGVLYEVMVAGDGPSPTMEDKVKVHYHGTLPDGTVFDSSVQPSNGAPATPAEFPLANVVKGFSSSLAAMKVGGKWKVVIPGNMAYGERGKGSIGPNQTLIFELELLEIVK